MYNVNLILAAKLLQIIENNMFKLIATFCSYSVAFEVHNIAHFFMKNISWILVTRTYATKTWNVMYGMK